MYLEYESLVRLDAAGDDIGTTVRVYFTAKGWQYRRHTTWEEPGYGGCFEDVDFLRAEIDSDTPLTDAEIAQVRAWFATDAAQDRAQTTAMAEAAV